MNNRLEQMMTNVIRRYGFEHYITIEFCRLAEEEYKNGNLMSFITGFYNSVMG